MTNGKDSALGMIIAVIVIIIVLGGALVLLPIGTGHHAVAKSGCLNNLKQCAQALKMYCDDYNNQMPSSFLVSHSKRWNAGDSLAFCTGVGQFPPGQETRRQTWAQVLYDNLGSPNIVFCPSDSVDHNDPNSQTSYWFKLANDKAWYGVGCKAPRRSMGDYGYESDQVAFYEHCGWHFGDNTGRLTNGMQVNMSFIDTHVSTVVFKNATSGDPINCAVNSDGEPMYYNTVVDPKTNQPRTDTGPAKHTDPACCYDSF